MSDRELLELAAKAAGMETLWDQSRGVLRARLPDSGMAFPHWNPLKDDRDALRLAVRLGLTVDAADETPDGDIYTPATRADDANGRMLLIEAHGTDPYAATRRAIVRAAAAIGTAK